MVTALLFVMSVLCVLAAGEAVRGQCRRMLSQRVATEDIRLQTRMRR
jgi:hypothetical protein